MASFKQFFLNSELLYNELKERYKECGEIEGHIKADPNTNFCYYCYRHLDYDILELSKPLKEKNQYRKGG